MNENINRLYDMRIHKSNLETELEVLKEKLNALNSKINVLFETMQIR